MIFWAVIITLCSTLSNYPWKWTSQSKYQNVSSFFLRVQYTSPLSYHKSLVVASKCCWLFKTAKEYRPAQWQCAGSPAPAHTFTGVGWEESCTCLSRLALGDGREEAVGGRYQAGEMQAGGRVRSWAWTGSYAESKPLFREAGSSLWLPLSAWT